MSNRTDNSLKQIHGTNPQFLIEQITRQKIYQTQYWKEQLFAINAETLVDKAISINHIGGIYGGYAKPTKFISLILKMLQIQPDSDIIETLIENEDYKYVTALGLFYKRLTGQPIEIFENLEKSYKDYRKIRVREVQGQWQVWHIDEFVDKLLKEDRVFGMQLPRLPRRQDLEEQGKIKERKSEIEDQLLQELMIKEMKEKEENENNQKNIKNERNTQDQKRKRRQCFNLSRSRDRNWRIAVDKYEKGEKQPKESKQSKQDKEPEEDSIEYWNKIRIQQGLKPLQ